MSDDGLVLKERLAALRSSFNEVFAEEPRSAAIDEESLLGIRLGADPFAVRISQITAFERARKVVPLPEAPAELMGLASLRGRLVPVYSLPLVLDSRDSAEHPWWLIVGVDEPVGLAVSAFLGHWRISAA